MSWLVTAAGILASITAVAHIVAGGRDIARPLLESALDLEVKMTLYACWHLVSVSLVASSLVILAEGLGFIAYPPVVSYVSAIWILYAVTFLVVTLRVSKPPGLLRLPQWTLLLPVGLLGLLGVMLH